MKSDQPALSWGVDLGGTKIEAVVLEGPRVLIRERIATEQESGYEHILGRIAELLGTVSRQLGIRPHRIGFGTPGAIEPRTGLLKNSNTICLNGMPLGADLERVLRVPVKVQNDADCFALAEAGLGAARGADSVFGVIMGTGVGGGVVGRGRVLKGRHGITGEWGHNVLEENGGSCYCGKRGCVETVISGPALERFHVSIGGTPIGLEQISARCAAGGDPAADAVIARLEARFAEAVSWVVRVIDPEVIVLGGGVSNLPRLYGTQVKNEMELRLGREFRGKIVRNSLGDSAGVLGAALLWEQVTY